MKSSRDLKLKRNFNEFNKLQFSCLYTHQLVYSNMNENLAASIVSFGTAFAHFAQKFSA